MGSGAGQDIFDNPFGKLSRTLIGFKDDMHLHAGPDIGTSSAISHTKPTFTPLF
jgi:hypothetical protein